MHKLINTATATAMAVAFAMLFWAPVVVAFARNGTCSLSSSPYAPISKPRTGGLVTIQTARANPPGAICGAIFPKWCSGVITAAIPVCYLFDCESGKADAHVNLAFARI
jgi:hypothetical protein